MSVISVFCKCMQLTPCTVTPTQREPSTADATATSQQKGASKSQKRKRDVESPVSEGLKVRKRKQRKTVGDKEYGVMRGVDFVDVACVLNFDLPTSSRSYTHRVGRTARAGRTGMSLSFVVPQDLWGKNKVVGCLPSAKDDETVFSKIEKEQAARGSKIQEYKFDMKQVEAFRYRMEDALRSVTRTAIKEARIKELKTEMLNSDKLKVLVCILKSPSGFTTRFIFRPTSRIIHLTSNICAMTSLSIRRGCNPT